MIQEKDASSMEDESCTDGGGADADVTIAITTQQQQQQLQQLQQQPQQPQQPQLHLKMYKPAKVLTQFMFNHRKRRNRTLLGDYVNAAALAGDIGDDDFPNSNISGIMAIGRLDEDSEGLLLLTTDGKVSERLRRRSVEKEYWVQVDGRITDDAIERLRRGVEIRLPSSSSSLNHRRRGYDNECRGRTVNYTTLPCSVHRLETVMVEKTKNTETKKQESITTSERKRKFKGTCNRCGKDGHKSHECDQNPVFDYLRPEKGDWETTSSFVALPPGISPSSRVATRDVARHGPTSWISIAIAEGKNRQVRRMTAAVGHATLRLVRVRIGPIVLDGMNEGEVRTLAQSDIDAVR